MENKPKARSKRVKQDYRDKHLAFHISTFHRDIVYTLVIKNHILM